MRSYLLLLIILTQIHATAFSQSRIKEFVVRNARTLNSISISDTNYADLKIIGDAIGNSKIVMLGEQDHGDAATFKAKARLIRYLHEQHGFNVLAFESDFFGLTGGYEDVRKAAVGLDSLLRGNLFAIWTTCDQFSDTWNYLRYSTKTNNPLQLAGIDNQLHGAYTAKHLRKLVIGLLSNYSAEPSFTSLDQVRYLRVLDSLLKYSARGAIPNPHSELEWFVQQTDELLRQLKAYPAIDSFTIIALENIRSICRHMQLYKNPQGYSSVFDERDVQMAKNLQWLATVKYPSEKIIVWAANGHISKNQYDVEPPKFRHQSLGAYFTKGLGYADQTYVIGFSSFEGTAGRTTQNGSKYQLPAREDNSFERWINQDGREYAFVNFRDFNRDNPGFSRRFTMSASNHFQQKGAWQQAFDGVFFIRMMYACDKTD
jgi:erythromycin esterase-like protein